MDRNTQVQLSQQILFLFHSFLEPEESHYDDNDISWDIQDLLLRYSLCLHLNQLFQSQT